MAAEASTEQYGAILARDVGMEARDGTWLATDIWRPALNGEPLPGPFPAILTRTPYGNLTGVTDSGSGLGEFFAKHGYVYATQDVRGRFRSKGDFILLADEGPDGYDAVEWVASLPYCDGNVGTQGTSYLAWTQSALAIENPPHLKAMWINQGSWNGNVSSLRHNGALELRWLTWAVTHGARAPEAMADPALMKALTEAGENMHEWLRRLPWGPGNSPLEGFPVYEKWAEELYTHGDANDDDGYWLQRGLNFEAYADESADVPTIYSGGWYDSYTRATTDAYVALSKRIAQQRLLMGPWTHGGAALERTYSGDVELGPEAPISGNLSESHRHMALRWFDEWLRGVDDGVAAEEPVTIFVMGGGDGGKTAQNRLRHGGHWRTESEWPLARAEARDYFIHADGGLVADSEPTDEGGSTSFIYDPEHPLPTVSANTSSLNEILPVPDRVNIPTPITLMRVQVIQGGSDQTTRPSVLGSEPPYGPLIDRSDVISFSTPPLDAPLEVTGPIEVTLHASSDAPDTDLFAMVIDVYPPSEDWPDGYRLNITDSLMRLRYRNGMDQPTPLQQGEVYEVTFPLYPTSNVFAAGHRIELLISSSSFPRFDVNPNTGEPIGRHTHVRSAENTLHHSAAYPSKLTLPVIPG